MLQIIVLLAISWWLLWHFEEKNLSVLGLFPTGDRLKYFTLLLIVSAMLAATAFVLRIYFAKESYAITQSLTLSNILIEAWHQFRTVFTEELLCRGALLYMLIKKTGPLKAVLISAAVFALLHWINAGVFGNPAQMMIVFVFTFAMGLLLAYSYARTFSLLLPLAIHYGWNLTQNYIFPETATGNHIFKLAAPPPLITISYVDFFAMLLLPKIAVLVIDYLIVKTHRQVELP
jgi:membrane protease YdiL (CAAX protease family)